MIVRPAIVIALWSEGPAPPRRLSQPAPGSASLTPCDCKALINCSIGSAKCGSGFIIGSSKIWEGERDEMRRRRCLQRACDAVVEFEMHEFGARVMADRIHHAFALDDEAPVEIGDEYAFALGQG